MLMVLASRWVIVLISAQAVEDPPGLSAQAAVQRLLDESRKSEPAEHDILAAINDAVKVGRPALAPILRALAHPKPIRHPERLGAAAVRIISKTNELKAEQDVLVDLAKACAAGDYLRSVVILGIFRTIAKSHSLEARVITELRRGLSTNDTCLRCAYAGTLAAADAPNRESMVRLLVDLSTRPEEKAQHHRIVALRELQALGPVAASGANGVARIAKDPDEWRALAGCMTWISIEPGNENARRRFQELARSKDPEIRGLLAVEAADLLLADKRAAEIVREELRRLQRDKDKCSFGNITELATKSLKKLDSVPRSN